MPINDSANIDSSGVLISSSGLSQLKLSDDKSTIEVGPGNRWSAVYKALEPHQLTVVGGRMGVVGVPGFLLGGGISFFSNELGWSSSNIAQFDVSPPPLHHAAPLPNATTYLTRINSACSPMAT